MTQAPLPQPGDILGAKYRIEGVLGSGGMGVVFEASHLVTRKRFAIKWLIEEPTQNDDSMARFVREAKVAGRCDHHNIVSVYDIDRHQGSLFMVMELLQGESLEDRLVHCERMAFGEACRLLVPVAEAVAEAHAAGIIHRDLKPGNIFVCRARGREAEHAKVLDFGVARFVALFFDTLDGVKTNSGTVVGTPLYMAPEQMQAQPFDQRVDVYSLGVTLFEVLTGVPPYHGETYGDLLVNVVSGKAEALRQRAPEVPAALATVVERAIAPDPNARFSTMSELARALEPFVAPRSAGTEAVTVQHAELDAGIGRRHEAGTSSARARARTGIWSLVIGIALLLGLLAGTFAWHARTVTTTSAATHAPRTATSPPPPAPTPAATSAAAPNTFLAEPAVQTPAIQASEPPFVAPEQVVPRFHVRRLQSPVAEPIAQDPNTPAQLDTVEPVRVRVKHRAPAMLQRSDF